MPENRPVVWGRWSRNKELHTSRPHEADENLAEKFPEGEEISAGEVVTATRGSSGLLTSARSGLMVGRYVACPMTVVAISVGEQAICDTPDA